MSELQDISPLEKQLGVSFKDKNLLQQAVVHRSYLNEHKNFPLSHNERLEFLGDAVLELSVTEFLYKTYPNPEGELTNWRASLVNAVMLAKITADLEVEKYLYLSRGEARDSSTRARQTILANAFEAIVGAIYLDQGWEASDKFIKEKVLVHLANILEHRLFMDPKSRFQESAQDKVGVTPQYRVMSESGPDHNKLFTVGVFLGKELVAEGTGNSKQDAQMIAAENGLVAKGW